MTDRDDELADLRNRLQDSENAFRELVLYRKYDQRKLGLANGKLRKWAMAIVKAGIERFPDKEIVAEAEAVIKEVQDDLTTALKLEGRKMGVGESSKDETFLPWLLSHPNIKNRFVEADERQSGHLEFWWEES